MSDVTSELAKQEMAVTYGWMSGQPNRNTYFVDTWLANLPPPASGTVWMYFELTYNGSMGKTIARHVEKCVLFICGSVDISYIFEAQEVADNYAPCGPGDPQHGSCAPLPPPCPGCSPPPSPWKPVLYGVSAGGAAAALLTWWRMR